MPNVVTPENNLITTETMSDAQIRELDFVLKFSENLKKLIEALGVTRQVPASAGTMLKTYEATGTLVDGRNIPEGEIIPLSQYTVQPRNYKEIELKKYRKGTSAENIIKYGFNQAVNMTTDKMSKDVANVIKRDFFDEMALGTGKATGVGLQATLAKVWGQLQTVFEDNDIETVHFINPLDIADYLANANVSTQTAFGMKYLEDFLGMGTVFMNTFVPQGKVYGTAKENIVMYYLAVNGADLGEAFNFTSDETGYIGIHETPDYDNLTSKDTIVDGVEFFAENLAGVVVGTISDGSALGGDDTSTTGSETTEPTEP